jgi:hypothetical protein
LFRRVVLQGEIEAAQRQRRGIRSTVVVAPIREQANQLSGPQGQRREIVRRRDAATLKPLADHPFRSAPLLT